MSCEATLLQRIDRVAPAGWAGINWLRMNDTEIAIERARNGLAGKTRERARQVRNWIAALLKPNEAKAAVEECIAAGQVPEDKVALVRRGAKDLMPIDWHKSVTNPPSAQRILMLPRNEVALMTAAQVAEKAQCLEPWAVQVLRKNNIPFMDVADMAGTKYHWEIIAPLEWFLLSDGEIGAKVGCRNVSVVAQYRERHGIFKYGNTALTTVRRYLMKHAADFRMRIMAQHLQGKLNLILAERELELALGRLTKSVAKAFPDVPQSEWLPPLK